MNQKKRLHKILNTLFVLSSKLILAIDAATVVLAVAVTKFDGIPALSYTFYLASAFALLVTVIGLLSARGRMAEIIIDSRLIRRLRQIDIIDRYFTDIVLRVRVSLYGSLLINLAYAFMKVTAGIYYRSLWLLILGIYYLILAVLRYAIIDTDRKHTIGRNPEQEYRRSRFCGSILFVLNQVLIIVTAMVIYQHKTFDFPGALLIGMACYSFYAVISASIGLGAVRKHGSPLMSTARSVSLTAAMVSMLSLEIAMIARYGDSSSNFAVITTSLTGAAVCVIVFVLAVIMIVKSSRSLKQLQKQ